MSGVWCPLEYLVRNISAWPCSVFTTALLSNQKQNRWESPVTNYTWLHLSSKQCTELNHKTLLKNDSPFKLKIRAKFMLIYVLFSMDMVLSYLRTRAHRHTLCIVHIRFFLFIKQIKIKGSYIRSIEVLLRHELICRVCGIKKP